MGGALETLEEKTSFGSLHYEKNHNASKVSLEISRDDSRDSRDDSRDDDLEQDTYTANDDSDFDKSDNNLGNVCVNESDHLSDEAVGRETSMRHIVGSQSHQQTDEDGQTISIISGEKYLESGITYSEKNESEQTSHTRKPPVRSNTNSKQPNYMQPRNRPSSAYSVLENVANYYYVGSSNQAKSYRMGPTSKGRLSSARLHVRPNTAHAQPKPLPANYVNSMLHAHHSPAFSAPSRIGWGEVLSGDVLGQINEANNISRMLLLRRRYKLVLNSPTTASIVVYDVHNPDGIPQDGQGKQKQQEVLMIETFVQAFNRLKQRLLLQYNRDKRLR